MNKVALVTGAARRIGAVIAKELHRIGMNIVLHYHHSHQEAQAIAQELNIIRPLSCITVQGDIKDSSMHEKIIAAAHSTWERLDVLVNNASSFYPTSIGTVDDQAWKDLIGTNLKGPFFLCQSSAPYLTASQGNIVNIADIHGERPLKNYPVYSIAKAGLIMLTKSLARELAPHVRVNAVAPGAVLWPEEPHGLTPQYIIDRTCLKRMGSPQDIAAAVIFLVQQNYMTGQVITVDGGRSIKA